MIYCTSPIRGNQERIVPVFTEKGRAREEISVNCARAHGKRMSTGRNKRYCAGPHGKRVPTGRIMIPMTSKKDTTQKQSIGCER
jgi:hypothetical protein